MEKLKQRILQDGRALNGGILKVDSFLNHQLDPNLMMEIARNFAIRLDGKPINKIVTIEASGIAPAIMLGYVMQLPVVFVKKKAPKTMENMLVRDVRSFTKDRVYTVSISQNFLTEKDHIVFIGCTWPMATPPGASLTCVPKADQPSRPSVSSSRKVFREVATHSAPKATT